MNYAFRVSQIPGLKVGAHSVLVVTLDNGNGGTHHLLIDAVTEKVRLRLVPRRRLGEWRHRNDPGTAVLFKRAELSTQLYTTTGSGGSGGSSQQQQAQQRQAADVHARASEGGVFCSPVRSGGELWEMVRTLSAGGYDAGTKNCHHFARDLWNWCVVQQQQSTAMPTDMIAQDVLMAASHIATASASATGGANA